MDIMDSVIKIGEEFSILAKLRAEVIAARRKKAQNNPVTKARKSRAMKQYWAEKKKAEKEQADEENYIRSLTKEERYPSCTCFLGNPPCTFCTDSNYCEACDISTWDEQCPKCGNIFDNE